MPVSEEQLLAEIRDIKSTLKSAPALNGGFDRLVVTVEHIKAKSEETSVQLTKLSEALYDPDSGVHARIKVVEALVESERQLTKLQTDTDAKLLEKLNSSLEEALEAKKVTERLQTIAGTNLEDLDALVQFRKNFNKLYWLLVAGIISSFAKFFWDLLAKR